MHNRQDLPLGEPETDDLKARRRDLLENIEELAGTFKYMGTGHPRYGDTKLHLLHLRSILEQMNETIDG